MGKTADLGRRVELVPMDPHFHDITIALYQQVTSTGPRYLVHSYSGRPGVAARLAFVAGAMAVLGGMEAVGVQLLRFPCGAAHELACRRAFLEACKLDPVHELAVRPLSFFDKKSGCQIQITSLGGGAYRVALEGGDESRAAAVAAGLVKLGQLESPAPDRVAFGCGQAHDALVGMLVVRAVNVRATLREQELLAARGLLVAPSAQQT
ncbi:MAG: hypothetical protein IT369_20285 [Candidatus Latescibacteria bacterium]|nr:hypothetical protein [Candidatus Latescibacterota bacterium]